MKIIKCSKGLIYEWVLNAFLLIVLVSFLCLGWIWLIGMVLLQCFLCQCYFQSQSKRTGKPFSGPLGCDGKWKFHFPSHSRGPENGFPVLFDYDWKWNFHFTSHPRGPENGFPVLFRLNENRIRTENVAADHSNQPNSKT